MVEAGLGTGESSELGVARLGIKSLIAGFIWQTGGIVERQNGKQKQSRRSFFTF